MISGMGPMLSTGFSMSTRLLKIMTRLITYKSGQFSCNIVSDQLEIRVIITNSCINTASKRKILEWKARRKKVIRGHSKMMPSR